MCHPDLRAAEAIMHLRMEEVQKQANLAYVQHQAGMVEPGWLAWQGNQVVGQMGLWLSALGKRMERRFGSA